MTPEELKREMEALRRELSELKEKVDRRERNQIQLPLDLTSTAVVGKALRDNGYAL